MLINTSASRAVPGHSSAAALGLALGGPAASVLIALLSIAVSPDGTPVAGFTAPVLQLMALVAALALSVHLAVRTLAAGTTGRARRLAVAALVVNATLGLASIAPLAYLFATLNQ